MVVKTTSYILVALTILIGPLSNETVMANRDDFLVNDDFTVTEQNYPRVGVAADGTFVIVWADRRASGQDIYLQKFDSEGYPVGSNQKVNDDTEIWTHQSEPAIGGDISGQYSVVWKDYRNGQYPFDPAIYFQRYDSSVTSAGVNQDLTASIPDSLKESPDISLSPWGGGVVVWADYRNRNWDIYAQRVSSVGTTVGPNFRVNDDAGIFQQHAPKVSISPDGWFVVVWYDNRTGDDDIMAQLYDSLGVPIGINFLAGSSNNTARQAFPDVAADGTGHFSVVWVDWVNGQYPHNPDIYYRKFDTTGATVGTVKKVNSLFSNSTQREVAISIDRMGHAAIVWADSTTTSWEIMGQMIDVDGFFREENFRANNFSDSAQQHPDVAVDGRSRYVVWADKRNGNYDIYAAIQTYNEPQLVPSVSALKFEMDVSGSLPPSQSFELDHAGYNQLRFEAILSHDWFSVTPSTGTTPSDLTVSIATDTLDFGTYLGAITLIDIQNQDSSVVLAVRLDVTAPLLELSADTLSLRAFGGIDEFHSDSLIVTNGGTGTFDWTASENEAWLTLSSYSGRDGDQIIFSANADLLSAGVYLATVQFSSAETYNPSDSLIVILEVIENMPYIRLDPDSVYAYVVDPNNYSFDIMVTNIGVGELNWTVQSATEWLKVNPASGIASETFTISLTTDGMPNDIYSGFIEVNDSASFSITERLPFILDLFVPPSDTIFIGATIAPVNFEAVAPVEIWNSNAITDITLPLKHDPSAFVIDSFVLSPEFASMFDESSIIDRVQGTLTARLSVTQAEDFLSSGHHFLGEIFFTAGPTDMFATIDSARYDTLRLSLRDTTGQTFIPMIIPGDITIGTPTDIAGPTDNLLPNLIELHQNYPNPFNAITVISFDLPQGMPVRLDIFNILGQRVTTLIDRFIPAGTFTTEWNGIHPCGKTAPSGIYFYRLETPYINRVRKLVLIK